MKRSQTPYTSLPTNPRPRRRRPRIITLPSKSDRQRELITDALNAGYELLEDETREHSDAYDLAREIRRVDRVPLSYALTAVQLLKDSDILELE